jgi:hypothetical protein
MTSSGPASSANVVKPRRSQKSTVASWRLPAMPPAPSSRASSSSTTASGTKRPNSDARGGVAGVDSAPRRRACPTTLMTSATRRHRGDDEALLEGDLHRDDPGRENAAPRQRDTRGRTSTAGADDERQVQLVSTPVHRAPRAAEARAGPSRSPFGRDLRAGMRSSAAVGSDAGPASDAPRSRRTTRPPGELGAPDAAFEQIGEAVGGHRAGRAVAVDRDAPPAEARARAGRPVADSAVATAKDSRPSNCRRTLRTTPPTPTGTVVLPARARAGSRNARPPRTAVSPLSRTSVVDSTVPGVAATARASASSAAGSSLGSVNWTS